jgi:hypothetical protein
VPIYIVTFGFGVALPALIAGGATLLLRRFAWGAGFACALGFVAAWLAVSGWPTLPPRDVTQWLPLLAVLAAVVGIVESATRLHTGLRWVVRVVAIAIALATQVAPLFPATWTAATGAFWISGFSVLWIVGWLCLEQLTSRIGRSWSAFVLMALGACTSVACGLSSSAAIAQTGGMLTAALGGLWVATLFARNLDWKVSVLPVAAILLPALLVNAGCYAELRPVTAVLLVLAPAGGWLAAFVLRDSRHRDWVAAAVTILLGAGAVAAAIVTSSPGGYE